MSTDPTFQPGEVKPLRPAPVAPPATATGVAWGNSAPLALAGMGGTSLGNGHGFLVFLSPRGRKVNYPRGAASHCQGE